jgi:hypothetical protein
MGRKARGMSDKLQCQAHAVNQIVLTPFLPLSSLFFPNAFAHFLIVEILSMERRTFLNHVAHETIRIAQVTLLRFAKADDGH